jgi:hypothetical protein
MSASLYGPSVYNEVFAGDRLVAGEFPMATDSITLLAGTVYSRGMLLGRVTASGKYALSASAAADGSQVPAAVLADNFDATAGDVVGAPVYLTGEFNAAAMLFGTGWTAATAQVAARPASIFLKLNPVLGDIVN